MLDRDTSITNIALVGGETYCREVLEKTHWGFIESDVKSHIVAVADPDPGTAGMVLAKEMDLLTAVDYHEFYKPENHIDLIIILSPDKTILKDILATKPDTIRVMAYHTFEIFWKAIGVQERKLRKRNEEVETILNSIQDFIIVIDPDKKISHVNETFLEKMGYERDEVIGKACYEIFQNISEPCKREDFACPLNEVVRKKDHHISVLQRTNRKGEERYIEVCVFPVWEDDGRISKFVEISRDITALRQEEEEAKRKLEKMVEERTKQLKETHAKLIHQDKMASLGKLSASVVHEINNPNAGILNLIMLIKRIISEGPVDEDEMKQFGQYLNLMEAETRRISRIVSNLLSFARQPKIEMRPLDMGQLIEKALLLNSNLLKINDIKVEKNFDADLPQMKGSGDQLQQVFMNFISNAVEAMENRDSNLLTFETTYDPKSAKITVIIQDTGVGIPESHFSKLFEPFFTTKKKGKGVGLGLSVAYGIIEEHDGTIRIESEIDKGTRFSIEFPAL